MKLFFFVSVFVLLLVSVQSACNNCAAPNLCINDQCVNFDSLNECTPACGDGQVCVAGTCIGQGGIGTCNPACNDGETCLNGECFAFRPGATCTPSCPANQYCIAGACVGAGGIGTCTPACAAGQTCFNGVCLGVGISNTTCTPACTDGQTCIAGTCVGTSGIGTCTPACNRTNGEYCLGGTCMSPFADCSPSCDSDEICVVGKCIPSFINVPCTPSCGNGYTCEYGACVESDVITNVCQPNCGADQICHNGACVDANAPQAGCTGCSGTQFCHYGTCVNCGPLCALVGGDIASFLHAMGVTAQDIENAIQAVATAATGFFQTRYESQYQCGAGNAIIFDNQVDNFPLVFGSADLNQTAAAVAAALAYVQNNIDCHFPAVLVNAPGSIAVDSGTRVNCSEVHVKQPLNIAYGSTAVATTTRVIIERLHISAPIAVSGPGAFHFPARHEDTTCEAASSCTCHFAGGANVRGHAGHTNIVVKSTESAVGNIKIDVNEVLETLGNILGTGIIEIAGIIRCAGAAIQPHMNVASTGKVYLNTTIGSFNGGAVTLNSGSQLVCKNPAGTYISTLHSCPAGATIIADISAYGTISSNPNGVILNYAQNTDITIMRCAIQIIDSTGSTIMVTNPNNNATVSRRLLQTDAPCVATWGSTSLTYACPNLSSANTVYVSAIAMVFTMISVLAMMI